MADEFDHLRTEGNEKFRNGNYGGALMCYTRCIDLVPTSFALYCNRAAALIKLDCTDEAEDDLKKSLEINPEYVPSLCRLGFLMLYEGNTVASLESYVKAVRVSSKHPHPLERFKGQLKEAIRLAEGRARQQGYSQDYIDGIITDDVRIALDSYHSLRNPRSNNNGTSPNSTVNSGTDAEHPNNGGAFPRGVAVASSIPFMPRFFNGNGDGAIATGTGTGNVNANNNATATPTFVQGPNGFSASFTMGANQANGLMDIISQLTGQVNPGNADQGPQNDDRNGAQNSVHNADTPLPVPPSPAANITTEQDPEIDISEVEPEASRHFGPTPAPAPAPAPTSAVHSVAHNAAVNFAQQRSQNGQPLNGADFARGLARTIATQVTHALAQHQGPQQQTTGSVGNQLRGIAQAAASVFLGNSSNAASNGQPTARPDNGNGAHDNASDLGSNLELDLD
ncbi:DEKNAAC100267 [Brettanomyces naardenensis]|uniref:DEKNAAC100267 n=1 Tax=Brettanomyces naardenensis TaxID=13370 RepID=A0A448YG85_BRENA|nr:DEKNAAC100267 [Brettanomyces naardenensis]